MKRLRKADLLSVPAAAHAAAAVILAVSVLLLVLRGAAVFAESEEFTDNAYFTGSEIKSTFSSKEIAEAISNLQPGDDVSFQVTYTNKYKESTDWYMANEVLQTLEKADQARKVPEGTGTPENGGYTYELLHEDKDGTEKILFSNSKVGGDARPNDMEGLEQATNALDDWFYIQTLGEGESGKLTLNVKFEGETEVNDYMDTDGGLMLRFAVNPSEKGSNPDNPDQPEYQQKIRTGDMVRLGLFAAMFAAGLIMLIIVVKKMRKEQGGEA